MIGDPKVLSDPHLSKKRSRPKVSAMSALKPKISQKAIIMHQKVSQVKAPILYEFKPVRHSVVAGGLGQFRTHRVSSSCEPSSLPSFRALVCRFRVQGIP